MPISLRAVLIAAENGRKQRRIMKLGRLMPNWRFAISSCVISAMAFMALPSQAENLKGTAVVLRTLDKVTATTKDYTVSVGDKLNYGSLTVNVRHCEKRPPEDIPETYAFLQIDDRKLDGKGKSGEVERVFSGWMLASKPAVSALDHGVYDVWVLDCDVPAPVIELDEATDIPKLRIRN